MDFFDTNMKELEMLFEDDDTISAVSYTHLDVYKRQVLLFSVNSNFSSVTGSANP